MVAPTGRRLGRYHLVEPVGAGPCGEVYRAKVIGVAGMERQFAIKRFYPTVLARPEATARLQYATRTYGGLDHPRIARLAELGVASGETFTATELVVGLDIGRLAAMAGDDRLPGGAWLGLVSAAARAIGYAHGRGVTHAGLCPTNLIATQDGDVKVTDFGILACRLLPRPAADETLAPRIAYLAPEQLLGETVTAAADVFALGVIAYELVSGAPPFFGGSAIEIEHAIVSGRPRPLELPRPLARVIDRCLARSPFERFPDARALADALDAALRLSPLAGGKHELATRVRGALEYLTRLNEQQLSGALNFAVPAGPPQRSNVGALPLPPPSPPPGSRPPPTPPPPPRPFRANVPLPFTAPPTEPGDEVTRTRTPAAPPAHDLSVGDETAPRIEPMWPPTEPVQLLKGPAPMVAPRPAPPSQPPPVSPLPVGLPPPPRAHPPASQPPPLVMVPMGAPPPMMAPPPARSRRGVVIGVVAGLTTLVAAATAVVLTSEGGSDAETPPVAATAVDAGASAPGADAGARPAVAAATVDAGRARDAAPTIDAAGTTDDPPPPPPTDRLVIASAPAAQVFLDGADVGTTPVTLPGSTDEHTVAIVLPGHALYTATIAGSGRHEATLAPVPERTGKGGIKVRCKAKRRYYVFVDGEPTGELCPTERIPVPLGTHTIEIYDLLTETRRTLPPLRVVKVNRSTRIKAD